MTSKYEILLMRRITLDEIRKENMTILDYLKVSQTKTIITSYTGKQLNYTTKLVPH